MGLIRSLQDYLIFHHGMKKLVIRMLTNKALIMNPLYRYFYNKKMFSDMERYRQKPRNILIENTNICSANCTFCPHDQMKRRKGTMSMELFKKIIDDVAENRIESVSLHGFGEPLMDKMFFERLEYCRGKNIAHLSTNTNAGFLTPETAAKIIESPLDEVYISFDAASAETYKKIRPGLDFDTVENHIRELCRLNREKKRGLNINLSFVETDDNCHETGLYRRKWKDVVSNISFSIIHNWGGTFDNIKDRHYYRDPCRHLWTDMNVNCEGKVSLCCYDYETSEPLGDLSTQTIREVWNGSKLQEFRKFHKERDFMKIPLCSHCSTNFHHKAPWWIVK